MPRTFRSTHIRETEDPKSDTLCGGSHSPIWGWTGKKKSQKIAKSVGPKSAARVAVSDNVCRRCQKAYMAKQRAKTEGKSGKVQAAPKKVTKKVTKPVTKSAKADKLKFPMKKMAVDVVAGSAPPVEVRGPIDPVVVTEP